MTQNQKPQVEIYLVHNMFHAMQPITWLSYLIRIATCSKWNHLAIRIGEVVIEAIGKGVIVTPLKEWMQHSDRMVLPRVPLIDYDTKQIAELEGRPYGFADLIAMLGYIKKTRWDGNSKFKVRNRAGYLCTELGGILIGYDGLLFPAEFEHLAGFETGCEFQTMRGLGIVS